MVESLASLGRAARKVAAAKYITLSTWGILAVAGAMVVQGVMNATTISVGAPKGSPSADANEIFLQYFPDVGVSTDFAAIIKCTDGCGNASIVTLPSVARFSNAFYTELKNSLGGELLTFSGYFELIEQGVPQSIVKKQLVSPNEEATLIAWTVKGHGTKHKARRYATEAQKFVDRLQKEKWLGAGSGIEILLAGLAYDTNAASTVSADILEHMDTRSLPVAICISGSVIRSTRLMVIPLLLLGVSLLVTFALLWIVSFFSVVDSMTPPMMMSFLIAMSFDYSLFICVRFREELGKRFHRAEALLADDSAEASGADANLDKVMDAIEATFSTSGFTVLLSGMTLASSFCILMICPVGVVYSMGCGCATTLFVTVAVALTLPPAMFAAFPSYFAEARSDTMGTNYRCQKNALARVTTRLSDELARVTTRFSDDTWSFLARTTTRFPWNVGVLLVVTGGTLALATRTLWDPGLKITDSLALNIPFHTETADASQDTADLFGKGKLTPYKLLLIPRSNSEGILSQDGVAWQKCISIVEGLVRNPNLYHTSPQDFHFAFYNNGRPLDWQNVKRCIPTYSPYLAPPSIPYSSPSPPPVSSSPPQAPTNTQDSIENQLVDKLVGRVLQTRPHLAHHANFENTTMDKAGRVPPWCKPVTKMVNEFVTESGSATYGYISLQWDPLSPHGQGWMNEVRRSLKDLGDETGFDLYLSGFAAESWDMIAQMYSLFPYMIAGSLTLAFVSLGVAFQSLVIPLRSIVSILLTLGFVFGLAVSTYESGFFDWTGMHGLSSKAGGISFFIPFMVFSVVMGICLDYDIFLLSRTVEVCQQTCDTRKAIQQSIIATGSVITNAGVIMVVAFGGLMFSNMWVLNQGGFFLAFAAFYDTFIVRTLVSPATMSLLGDWHWWPSPLFRKCRAARLLALELHKQNETLEQHGDTKLDENMSNCSTIGYESVGSLRSSSDDSPLPQAQSSSAADAPCIGSLCALGAAALNRCAGA